MLDARLRAATTDAYVDAIETQFGGLEAAGIEPGDLRDRYREAAVAAPNAAAFYGVPRREARRVNSRADGLQKSGHILYTKGCPIPRRLIQFAARALGVVDDEAGETVLRYRRWTGLSLFLSI